MATPPSPLITEDEAAELIGMTPRFLQERRYRGDGPTYVKLSPRAIRYDPEDLRRWIDERKEAP